MDGIVMDDIWTPERIARASAFVIERLAADFAHTPLPKIELHLDPGWTGTVSTQPGPQDVICVCGGHEFQAQLQGGVEQACVTIAWQLQDDVMDKLNRPWPELLDQHGNFVGVPTPDAGPIAAWKLKDEPFCAVGHLHRAVDAAGLRIR